MRVIMAGGGTGGHIYPAIAIADKIMERSNDSEILFVGTKKGLESRLVPENGYDIEFIDVIGLNRKNLLKNIKFLTEYNKGRKQAKKIIEEFKPDVVIGTGGYVSGPLLKMAAAMGIKTYVQEQNAFPGLANKFLEKNADKIFLGFEEAGKYFKQPEKHLITGNPVRNEFLEADVSKSRAKLGVKEDDFVLLAFGGSQGAGRINKAMLKIIEEYNGREGVKVFFSTGSFYYQPILSEIKEMDIDLAENIQVKEYISDMADHVASADLIISRSGAIAIAEITISGKPSILIPSPNVTNDHQTFNAKAVADKGGAILMKEEDLKRDELFAEVERLRVDKAAREKMANEAKLCGPVDATDIIYYSLIT